MCQNFFNENRLTPVINSRYQSKIVAFDVEHRFSVNLVSVPEGLSNIIETRPFRAFGDTKPRVQRPF